MDDIKTLTVAGLGENDLLTILNELTDVAPQWELLATCLRLSTSDIANIRSKYSGNVNLALSEVILRWLATRSPDQLTWSDLVKALRQPILNEERIASQIERQFLCSHKPASLFKSVSSPTVLDHDSFAKELIQNEGISTTYQRDSSSSQITPCDSVGTPGTPKMLFIGDDQNGSLYSCGCGECKLETFNTKCCLNPLETNCHFPYVNTKGLGDGEKEVLEYRLNEAFMHINHEYSKFTFSLRKSLEKRNITPKELADVLMDLRGYQPLTKSLKHPSLLEDRYDELRSAEDISRAFKILSDYSSFFNYNLIAFIVEVLGTEEDQQNLISYKEKLAVYCKRHVFECPSYSEETDKLASFTLKVDPKMTVGESGLFTAESLLHYKTKVAEVFSVTRYSLKLCSVREGCLEILFQTPRHIMEVILTQINGNKKDLCALGIQKVWYGDKEFSTVYPALQAQSISQESMSYGLIRRSHSFPSQSSICRWYWLTGSCKYKDSCVFSHNIDPIKSPAVGSILFPETHKVSDEAFLKIKPLGRSQDGKSYVIILEEKKIIAENLSTLEYAQKKILRYLQSISAQPGHSVTRLKYTYFHPDGVEQAHLYVFKQRKYRRVCEVHKVPPKEPIKKWNIEDFEHLNKEHVTHISVYSRLQRHKRVEYPVLFRRNYREDIQARLAEGLRWMHEKGLIPKLEGRFGKILWKESPGDKIMDASTLANFASVAGSDGLIFATDLDSQSPAALKNSCLPQIGFKDETYMFVLKARKSDESYRIRVKVQDRKPKIVYVRQLIDGRIQAQVLFDILCLHRKYDIRLSLQSVDKASTDNPSIARFISSSIEIPEPGVVHYNPFATNEKWSLTYIRHQQWESYEFHKYHTVSISAIGSYQINTEKLKPLVIRLQDCNRHYEVELHCTLWEDLDAHSSDQYVNPHVDLTSGDSTTKPWTPKKILDEFEKEGFLQMMDELNKAMEFVPVVK